MKKTESSFIFLLSLFLAFSISCGEKKAPPKLILDIPVVTPTVKEVAIMNDFVGQTFGYFDIAIRARVEGFLVGTHFKEGSFVKKGELLYSIDPEPFKAKVAEAEGLVAEAKTNLALAKSDLDRIRPLAEINAVAQSDLDAAESKYEAAQARLEASEASLRYAKIELGYCTIRSPIEGLIGKTEAKIGDFVGREPNPVVLNAVSRIDTIQVRFSISERKYLQLARVIAAEEAQRGNKEYNTRDTKTNNERSKIYLILADGTQYEELGKFDFSDRQVDPSTGTLLLQASFPNPSSILIPGQFARIRVAIDNVKDGILIPQRCTRELQGQYQVFTVDESNIVSTQNIKVANKMDSMWLVTEGLDASSKVVFGGIQKVSPGMEINPIEGQNSSPE